MVELQPQSNQVLALHRRATDVAGVCRDIVLKTAQSINGRKYVRVEGWQAIANTFGCFPSIDLVEAVAGGVRAIAKITLPDGRTVTGEGFVGDDEALWAGGGFNKTTKQPHEARPMFARRAMAQTRAISRVCRSAFAFVVVLIDANLSTTPAEEMEGIIDVTPSAPAATVTGVAALKATVEAVRAAHPKASPPRQAPPAQEVPFSFAGEVATANESHDSAPRVHPAVEFKFGGSKGKNSFDPSVSMKDLLFYVGASERSIADPTKEKFHDKERRTIDALRAEIDWREVK